MNGRATKGLVSLVAGLPVPWAIVDAQMRYLDHHEDWALRYCAQAGSVVGQSHYDLFPDPSGRWRGVHRDCLRGGSHFGDREPFLRRDGTTLWLRWLIIPWRDDGDVGLLMIAEPREVEVAAALDLDELLPGTGCETTARQFLEGLTWVRTSVARDRIVATEAGTAAGQLEATIPELDWPPRTRPVPSDSEVRTETGRQNTRAPARSVPFTDRTEAPARRVARGVGARGRAGAGGRSPIAQNERTSAARHAHGTDPSSDVVELAALLAHRLNNPLQSLVSHVWLAEAELGDGEVAGCAESLAEIQRTIARLEAVARDLRLLTGRPERDGSTATVSLAVAIERAAMGDHERAAPARTVDNPVATDLVVHADPDALVIVLQEMLAEVDSTTGGALCVCAKRVAEGQVELAVCADHRCRNTSDAGSPAPGPRRAPEMQRERVDAGALSMPLRIAAARAATFGATLLAPASGPCDWLVLSLRHAGARGEAKDLDG